MAESRDDIFEVEVDETVTETDDGGSIVKLGPDEEEEQEPNREFYDNIVDDIEEPDLQRIATQLLQDTERDKKSRERRDKDYEEAIKRTGLGKEAPGGADFEGASTTVHPMLTEACVDFASRAIKELMPPNGPVKTYVPGDDPPKERMEKADRQKDYMNWQFLQQMPDFRIELEQLLTQLPLGGSQYLRMIFDMKRKRPVPTYWPSDDVWLPYAASNYYTSERITFVEHITSHEFKQRIDSGMYRDVDNFTTTQPPQSSDPQKATDRVEGKQDVEPYNQDGLRDIYEVMCYSELEDEYGYAPYRISIDSASRKIVAINRNWEEDDEAKEAMYWTVEFPFMPWRGAVSVGLGQMIGSLSGAATGALRALLDSAHINNMPTLLRLKGANLSGQSKELNVAEVTEIEGGVAGNDNIRNLVMAVPFNPPSGVLMELLNFVTDAGRGLVQTTFEKLSEQNPNLPVGTTLALIEEGMTVFSAIHLRLYQAMTMVLKVLNRINRMYLDEDEVKDDIGEVLAFRRDFDKPFDVLPVADPEVFSDVQRMAQLQVIADRAQQMPEIYNQRAIEKRILERTKIPNSDELLLPQESPKETNAVNENAAMSLGRPVVAFPEQDHLAHIQVHLDFFQSPMFGQNPLITPQFLPMLLNHLKEHLTMFYVTYNYEAISSSVEGGADNFAEIMKERDPETRKELDRLLAAASPEVVAGTTDVLTGIQEVIQQAMQMAQQMQQSQQQQQQIPIDPNAKMAIEQEEASDQRRDELERLRLQVNTEADREKQAAEHEHEMQMKFMELDATERQKALDAAQDDARRAGEYAARLEELMEREAAASERTVLEAESREEINADDNRTALEIAGLKSAESESKDIRTGESVTDPDPS